MAQSDHQLLIQSKPYLYATILSGMLALLTLFKGEIWSALGIITLCGLLVANFLKNKAPQSSGNSFTWFKNSSMAIAIISLLGLMMGIESFKTWCYFIPLLLFFFYEFKPALWLVGSYSVLTLFFFNISGTPFENIQASMSYLLYLSMSCGLVYLRELRRKQLKPLRRTDNLTKAATREHLGDDLTKEIQRSEREGCELSTVALAIDKICLSKLTPKEQDSVTIAIGKLLHNNLRLFDSYYLWEHHEFLIVLPHTSSVQAVKIADGLRIKIRKETEVKGEHITVSAGVSCLNIGDDSGSLSNRATQALSETQTTSINRTHIYREIDDLPEGLSSANAEGSL
jgi:diguanylate cyclase (GGDEF)-like protein